MAGFDSQRFGGLYGPAPLEMPEPAVPARATEQLRLIADDGYAGSV